MEALIRTKFYIPQFLPNGVARPRLVRLLSEGVERSLTLISAPPGFGKTTLLSEWVAAGAMNSHGTQLPVAWLSLDEHDNNPGRFGKYLLAALSRLDIHIDATQFASPASAQPPLDLLITALINQAEESASDPDSRLHAGFVLVLDDHQQIVEQAVHDGLAFLLTHLPPQMHVIIASRADPRLPLAQLRARGQLLELRANDMRFQPDEISTFLNQKMGLNLSAEAISALDARTEGWAAALQLAALAMQNLAKAGNPPENPAALFDFTGSHRYIVDYLAEQVLNQLPAEIQEFLLATSILERLSGSLCDAVFTDDGRRTTDDSSLPSSVVRRLSSDSQSILETLERANLFLIPLDGERQWYRYHPLFAGFLRERLRKSQSDRWIELHRRAAEYFERSGWIPEAVDHVLAVGDSHQAARMVEGIAEEIWMSGEMIRLLGWLEALPDHLIRSHPRLCIFHAWILNILADSAATEGRLRDAEQALAHPGGEVISNQEVTRGMLAATRAIIAIMEGDATGAIELSQRALEFLPEENWVWRSVVIRNLGNAYLLTGHTAAASQAFQEAFLSSQAAGNSYMTIVTLYELAELQIVQGQLHKAYRTCIQALELASGQSAPGFTITGAVHVGLSEILRQWNELGDGLRHALSGIELGKRGRSLGIQVCGYTRLALIARALGDEEGAYRYFQHAAQLAPHRRRTSFIAHHDVQASLWGRQGDPESSIYWAEQIGLLDGLQLTGEINYMNETAHIALVQALLGLNRAEDAYRLAERLRQDAEGAGRMGRLIEILALQALALKALGTTSQALAVLRQALALAEPQGYVRVFVDEGEDMGSLIQQLKTEIEKRRRSSMDENQLRLLKYANKLLAAFGSVSTQPPSHRLPENTTHFPVKALASSKPPSGNLHLQNLQSLISNLHTQISNPLEPLSQREKEILSLIAAGLSNQQVASRLVLAPSTINWHMKNIYSKLDVHSRTQAVARAVELGIFA